MSKHFSVSGGTSAIRGAIKSQLSGIKPSTMIKNALGEHLGEIDTAEITEAVGAFKSTLGEVSVPTLLSDLKSVFASGISKANFDGMKDGADVSSTIISDVDPVKTLNDAVARGNQRLIAGIALGNAQQIIGGALTIDTGVIASMAQNQFLSEIDSKKSDFKSVLGSSKQVIDKIKATATPDTIDKLSSKIPTVMDAVSADEIPDISQMDIGAMLDEMAGFDIGDLLPD